MRNKNLQILYAQQDFYDFLVSFFALDKAKYFIWAPLGRYAAALRVEPYKEGLLLEALETAPNARREGYGAALLQAVLRELKESEYQIVYSHVNKRNRASLNVHKKCGFSIISDSATYVDGTITQNSYTLCYNL